MESLERRLLLSATSTNPDPIASPPVVVGEILVGFSGDIAGDYQQQGRVVLEDAVEAIVGENVLSQPEVLALLPATDDKPASLSTRWQLSDGVAIGDLLGPLTDSPHIAFAEPNYVLLDTATAPSDPQFPQQWHLNNTGQSGGVADADIDAPEAWDRVRYADEVVIGLIDTGVDYSHPELAASIWTNPGEIPGDGLDNDANGFIDDVHGWDFFNGDNDPFDDNGHGTHVAGTIAAAGNNNDGISGVSWQAKLMPLKFLDSTGTGTIAGAVAALSYATTMCQQGVNVRMTNNSWGGGGYSQALADAIEASRQCNMLFVASAGNNNSDSDQARSYPASYPADNIIAVAASDAQDGKASFSDFGPASVDLAAPGVDILSTLPDGQYGSKSGTSMAVPQVTGVAALAWSVVPEASYQRVRDALFAGTDSIASMDGMTVTGGRLNALGTLSELTSYRIDDGPTAIPDGGTLTSTLTIDDSLTIADLDVELDITHSAAQDLDVFLIAPDGTRVELFTDVGGNGNDFGGTMLDDEASTLISAGSAPFSGSYQPEGSLALLDGKSSAGVWTLEVSDDKKRNTGTLNSWSLKIATRQPEPPAISIDDVQLAEGDAGTTEFIFTVTRSGDTSKTSRLSFRTEAGTASEGSDYGQNIGSLEFRPDEISKSIVVEVFGDLAAEPNETFFVDLSTVDNGKFEKRRGIGTIEDDEGEIDPSFVISDSVAVEGSIGLATIDRFITDTGSSQTRNLAWGPDGNGDGEPDLYVVGGGSNEILRFDGISGTKIDVFVEQGAGGLDDPVDLRFGPDGNLYVTSRGTNARPDNNQVLRFDGRSGEFIDVVATGLQRAISIDFGDDGILYAANRETNAIERFDPSTGQSLGYFISQASGSLGSVRSATFGVDLNGNGVRDLYVANLDTREVLRYDGSDGSLIDILTIPSSYGSLLWIDVGKDGSIYASTRSGPDDSRILNLDGTNGRILREVTIGRDGWSILVDDNGVIYVGGNGGGQVVDRILPASVSVLSVSLSTLSSSIVTVDFTTVNGSAFAGVDYVQSFGTITFAPGDTSKTIIVPTIADEVAESDETFFVNLSNAIGATILDGQGEATIRESAAGVTITPLAGTTTSEAGGSVRFQVSLNSPPVGTVSIRLQSSDTSEGLLRTADGPNSATDDMYLEFDSSDYYQPQEFDVVGVDDYEVDSSTSYEIIVTIIAPMDPWYDSYPFSNIQLLNLDDESDPTSNDLEAAKFYVVDATADQTFEYRGDGSPLSNNHWQLAVDNANPRGATSNADGSLVWVIDDSNVVFVYSGDGTLLDAWPAGSLQQPEGIATDGTHLWIVDRGAGEVLRYADAASPGNTTVDLRFPLDRSNKSAMGITGDGTSLWIVDDGRKKDRVFKYNAGDGQLLGNWTLASSNSHPTGITIDPSGASDNLWIVDSGADAVYEYAAALGTAGGSLVAGFDLAATNIDPQGIADPPTAATMVLPRLQPSQVAVATLARLEMTGDRWRYQRVALVHESNHRQSFEAKIMPPRIIESLPAGPLPPQAADRVLAELEVDEWVKGIRSIRQEGLR